MLVFLKHCAARFIKSRKYNNNINIKTLFSYPFFFTQCVLKYVCRRNTEKKHWTEVIIIGKI